MTGAIVGWHRLRSREDTKECQDDSESQRRMIHRTIRLSGERCGMWNGAKNTLGRQTLRQKVYMRR